MSEVEMAALLTENPFIRTSLKKCLTCNSDQTVVKSELNFDKRIDAVRVFCQYMNLPLNHSSVICEFPFCETCSISVIKLFECHVEKEKLLGEISKQLLLFVAKIIEIQDPEDISGFNPLRKAACQQYDARVRLVRMPTEESKFYQTEDVVEYPQTADLMDLFMETESNDFMDVVWDDGSVLSSEEEEEEDLDWKPSKPEKKNTKTPRPRKSKSQKASNSGDDGHSDRSNSGIAGVDKTRRRLGRKIRIKKEKQKKQGGSKVRSTLVRLKIGDHLIRYKYYHTFFDQTEDGYICNTCDERAKTFRDMKKHCTTVHHDQCEYLFKLPSTLEELHVAGDKYSAFEIEFDKVGEDSFLCGSCEDRKPVPSWKGMIRHIIYCHKRTKEDQVKCQGIIFTKHKEAYRCDKCGTHVTDEEIKTHKAKYHADLLNLDELRVEGNKYKHGDHYFEKEIFKNSSGISTRKWKCLTCGMYLPYVKGMMEHFCNSHGAEPPIKIVAEPIKYGSERKAPQSRLEDHQIEPSKYQANGRTFIKIGEEYKCETCEVTKSDWRQMVSHMRHHQRPKNPNFKPVAPNKFEFRGADSNNSSFTVSLVGSKYTCDICGTEKPKLPMFKKHFIVYHKAEIPVTSICDTCGKGFADQYSLATHIKTHSEKLWICSVCSKSFSTRCGLKSHERLHQGEETKQFQCEFCGKAFHFENQLKKHRLSHTKDAKEVCPDCGKVFVHNAHLWSHRYSKHIKKGKKEHPCPECGTLFLYKASIPRHILVAHRGFRSSDVYKRRRNSSAPQQTAFTPQSTVATIQENPFSHQNFHQSQATYWNTLINQEYQPPPQ